MTGNFAQQIFFGLLIEFISLLVAYVFKKRPIAALTIIFLGTVLAGIIAFFSFEPPALIMEINFTGKGDGKCNDYGVEKLGYAENRYYIQPDSNAGRIAICHKDDNLLPQGALQVLAYPEENSSEFGYAVLFGWNGFDTTTTDACYMGIRKRGSITEAVFVDWVAGDYNGSTKRLKGIVLDDHPHVLRVVLNSNGFAKGYIDGKKFATH